MQRNGAYGSCQKIQEWCLSCAQGSIWAMAALLSIAASNAHAQTIPDSTVPGSTQNSFETTIEIPQDPLSRPLTLDESPGSGSEATNLVQVRVESNVLSVIQVSPINLNAQIGLPKSSLLEAPARSSPTKAARFQSSTSDCDVDTIMEQMRHGNKSVTAETVQQSLISACSEKVSDLSGLVMSDARTSTVRTALEKAHGGGNHSTSLSRAPVYDVASTSESTTADSNSLLGRGKSHSGASVSGIFQSRQSGETGSTSDWKTKMGWGEGGGSWVPWQSWGSLGLSNSISNAAHSSLQIATPSAASDLSQEEKVGITPLPSATEQNGEYASGDDDAEPNDQ